MIVIDYCIEAFKERGPDDPMKKKKSVVIYELKTLFPQQKKWTKINFLSPIKK